MKDNTKKNTGGVTGKGFDVNGQPSPEAKKAGWDRRREAQQFMDMVMKYKNLSLAEFTKLGEKIKNQPAKFTIGDLLAYKYVAKSNNTDKFLIDWINRHISYAPQNVQLENIGEPITQVTVKIINSKDELKHDGNTAAPENTGDGGTQEDNSA